MLAARVRGSGLRAAPAKKTIARMSGPGERELPPIFPPWVGRVFQAIVGLIGVALLGQALLLFARDRDRAKNWTHVDGTVVAIANGTMRNPSNNSLASTPMYPVVEFTSDGQTSKFQSPEGHVPPVFAVQDKVPVLFPPGRPQEAEIDWGGSPRLEAFLAVLGALVLALALRLALRRRPRPA